MHRTQSALFAAAACAVASSAAVAGPQVTFNGVAAAWGSSTNGGPFAFTPNAALASQIQGIGLRQAGAGRFVTFCIERNEFLSNTPASSVFNVTISTAAVMGGVSGQPGPGLPDPLGFATAYLYTNFMYGTLTTAGVTYSGGAANGLTTRTGDAMQAALWYLEGEITATNTLGLDAATVALANALILEAQNANWTTIGNVRVLNLFDTDGGEPRQSQLVLIPLPGGVHMASAGLAMLSIGVIGRRRQIKC